MITYVDIKYLDGIADGPLELLDKIDPLEARFRINRDTDFETLKINACKFWVSFIKNINNSEH